MVASHLLGLQVHANGPSYVFSNNLVCLYNIVRNILNYFFAFEEVNSLIFVDNEIFVELKVYI